jgi:chemotaxis protein methyltransferase CheR
VISIGSGAEGMSRPLSLHSHEFVLLRDLVAERFGLQYTDELAYLLERRLLPRVEALGLRSFLDYHDYLLNTSIPESERAQELSEIFEILSTRETYFFRESYQLDALRKELLPRLAVSRRHSKRLRFLSAGCASGEEAYSLAVTLCQSGLFASWDLQVVGCDLSLRALETARRGLYGRSSFRQVSDAVLGEFFELQPDGRRRVCDEVRRQCRLHFLRANLSVQAEDWAQSASDAALLMGPFDAIFCRNLLIYFSRPRRTQLLAGLAQRLASDGVLFLGHSESLHDLKTPFVLDRLAGELVYRLPSHHASLAASPDAASTISPRQGG